MSETVSTPPAIYPPAPALSRDERRVRAARDVLRTTIRDLYLAHYNGQPPPGDVPVKLSLRVTPSDQWNLEFDPPLVEQLLPQLADREAARDVIRAGHVYCFRCLSSACEHSHPASPLSVFTHYDAAGRPEWQELAQALIDVRNERVDQLYAQPPRLVAHFQYGRELKGQQLATFGKASLSYSILAQVIAGYLDRDGERLAVTVHFVEARDGHGEFMLRINPIGHGLDGQFLLAWLAADKSARLFRALQIAERETAQIEDAVKSARAAGDRDRANQMMGRIPGVARRLVEALERGERQSERRTRHVEDRRQEQRPVHKARADAEAVRRENCFWDEKAKTYIVLGDRGRAHAFNEAGRHVTSFIMKPSAVEFRRRSRRWLEVSAEDWGRIGPLLKSPPVREIQDDEDQTDHS